MSKSFFALEPRSLLIIASATIGNGQVLGVDVVVVLLALCTLLQFRAEQGSHGVIPPATLMKFPVILVSFCLVLATMMAVRIEIPYFGAYELWPMKALWLMLLILVVKELRWPMGNTILWGILCVALLVLGTVEGGRIRSVFGPNMLYRIFGLLLMFSLMAHGGPRSRTQGALFLCSALALYGASSTGSSGALLVMGVVATAYLVRYVSQRGIVRGGVVLGLFIGFGALIGTSLIERYAPTIYTRLLYKLDTMDMDDRLIGWGKILDIPYSHLGQQYDNLASIWTGGFAYPHNVWIELYTFYGIVGVLLSAVIVAAIVISLPRAVKGDIVSMTLLVLTTGAALSGDLSDNYGVIGLGCATLLVRDPLRWARR